MKTFLSVGLISLICFVSGCEVSETPTSLAGPAATSSPVSASPSPQKESSLPEERVLAIIDYGDERETDVITIPETVTVDRDFQVEIKSFGGGCEREGGTGTIVTENSADVMVYDLTTASRPGVVCTAILKRLPHTVTLRFSKTGSALIRVWGRRPGGGTTAAGVPVVLEKRVIVKQLG